MLDSILTFLDQGLLNLRWWEVVLYTLVTTHLTIVSVTIYLHRCQAHRALDLHPAVSHVFRFWLWLSTGMVTKEWAAIHRRHHAKCETEGDPHSPVVHGVRKVLWQGTELYRQAAKERDQIEKYGHGTPNDWIEQNLYTRHSATGVVLMLIINVLLFGVIGVSVWAIQMVWIPFWAAGVINGLGHHMGYRNFDAPDASTNLIPIGILIGGEEMHNNHHAFGTSAKFSNKWYEFDIGWMYIRILSAFGLAKVRKVAPKAKLVAARPMVDLEAVQAVIHHRYDVMSAYASSLRRACREEAARLYSASREAEGKMVASAKHWLTEDATKWTETQKAKLQDVFAASDSLRKLVEMRGELSALWERSHASREQLVHQLQEWCARAEQSGVRALQDLSLRMRSYKAV